jgi:hypothetical protein
VAAGDTCSDLGVAGTVFLKEEDARRKSVPDDQGSGVIPGQHTSAWVHERGLPTSTGPHQPPSNRPLTTVLRI